MKKSMIAFGVAALCGAVSFADVTSANIVGYKGDNLVENDFNMIAIPFANVNGGSINLNTDVEFKGIEKVEYADINDYLHVYINGEGYTILYYHHDDYEVGHKWHMADGWYTTSDEPFEDIFGVEGLPVGTAMWFEANPSYDRSEPLSVMFSGAVEGAKSVTLEGISSVDFNMIANPYPVAWCPNDKNAVVFENCEIVEYADINDYLHVYINGEGYTIFYNHHDDYAEGHKWHLADGWYTTSDEPITDIFDNGLIPAGTAMWYEANPDAVRDGDLSITFYSPIK